MTTHVSLTLTMPDGQSRSFQCRRCVALGVEAYNLVLVQEPGELEHGARPGVAAQVAQEEAELRQGRHVTHS